jgi:hypothetical protein
MRQSFWKKMKRLRGIRLFAAGLGVVLMLSAPLVAPLPGPAGTFFFAIGLGLVLQNSAWARRRYVHLKRRYPKPGHWADWGLRRPSYKRRLARKKQGKDD